jgi:hypothetical protein
MLKRELIDLDSKEKHTVSFFEDDNIQTVREQLAKSSDSHPDRMFILANIKYPKDYYTADIRNWDALFERLSYNGRIIEKSVFDEYQRMDVISRKFETTFRTNIFFYRVSYFGSCRY